MLPIFQAYAEGKTIQFRCKTARYQHPSGWSDNLWLLSEAVKDGSHYIYDWRINPEPKLRAWTASEVPVGAMLRSSHGSMGNIISACPVRFYYVREGNLCHESRIDGFCYCDALTYVFNLEHSKDGGKTWLPCGVYEQPPLAPTR